MNILITGAAGFIGSQLAYKFVKENHNVTLIDNMSYGHKDNLMFDDIDLNANLIEMDIRDRGSLEALFEDINFDYVYTHSTYFV